MIVAQSLGQVLDTLLKIIGGCSARSEVAVPLVWCLTVGLVDGRAPRQVEELSDSRKDRAIAQTGWADVAPTEPYGRSRTTMVPSLAGRRPHRADEAPGVFPGD